MAAPGLSVRCPACGTELKAVPAAAPPTQWFPCPHCRAPVPVVLPRDPPPLYTWEVLPGLYPPLGRPRAPRWRIGRAVAIALAVTAVACVVLGGLLAYYGVGVGTHGSYSVSGVVLRDVGGVDRPADLARVVLTDNNGANFTQVTGPDGTFAFGGIPTGGVSINVTLSGYSPETLTTFVSSVYNAGSSNLTITLEPGGPANGTAVALAPFPDLESFLASVDGGAALLVIGGAVAAFAAAATQRHGPRAAGVVGGAAGLCAPAVLLFLGLYLAFPVVVAGTAVAAGLGAFALTISAAELYRSGAPNGPA